MWLCRPSDGKSHERCHVQSVNRPHPKIIPKGAGTPELGYSKPVIELFEPDTPECGYRADLASGLRKAHEDVTSPEPISRRQILRWRLLLLCAIHLASPCLPLGCFAMPSFKSKAKSVNLAPPICLCLWPLQLTHSPAELSATLQELQVHIGLTWD